MIRRALVSLCGTIAVLDALQPVLLPWVPKLFGAVAGALFYAVAAVAVARGHDRIAWAVALLPLVPVTVLTLWAAGVALPVQPDIPMVGILVLQVAAAGAAGALLRGGA